MWYVCDMLYAVLYVCISCFVVRGCDVSRMGGTHGSGVLSSAGDVLDMSVVRGVCVTCIFVWLGAGWGGRCWG